MTMQTARVVVKGIAPLLTNNPQTVDRFNAYARKMKNINDKKTRRTDDDYLELRNLELASKIYFDDEIGAYVPATWVSEGIAGSAFATIKVGRDKIRGSLFVIDQKIKLEYQDMGKVKAAADIIANPQFRHAIALPQGQVRVVKVFPIFHKWSFTANVEFDDSVLDRQMLVRVCQSAGKYVGFGDLRPTFGRAEVEVKNG